VCSFIPGVNMGQPSRKRTIFHVWCSDPKNDRNPARALRYASLAPEPSQKRKAVPICTSSSPSAGLGGRFGEQPDHPQVLDGLIWAFRTFRVFWSGWYSEPVVVLLGFDGWPVIKGPLYRAGTTPPSIRRSAPVM
jgi:hypothetical protein